MAHVRVESLSKRYGAVQAISDLNFEVHDQEFFCLLGPPGVGKTTTLTTILGAEIPDAGNIYVDGQLVNHLDPGDRDMAIIFQNLALYPHKTIFENLAFPLRNRKVPHDEIKTKVHEVAKTLKIEHTLDRTPATLSGGERQRVAIGRAIVRQPKIFLMDEPLSNLDALLRVNMRSEMKRLQMEMGQTYLYATHDQVEAMSMADRIAVMHGGAIHQCDTPERVYTQPADKLVAGSLGSPAMNFLSCRLEWEGDQAHLRIGSASIDISSLKQVLERVAAGRDLILGIRPQDISLSLGANAAADLPAQVVLIEPLGSDIVVTLKAVEHELKTVVPFPFEGKVKQTVGLTLDRQKLHLFDPQTEKSLAIQ